MNLKRIIILLLVIIVVIVVGRFGVKKYLFPYSYKEYVDKYSQEYDVDPLLVLAIIKTESGFKSDAVSRKDAKGLMQIMDDTGAWIAEKLEVNYFLPNMLFQPELNIKFGTWYINHLSDEFDDIGTMVAAYNGGIGNVKKWLQDKQYSNDGETLWYIPFKETKKYVDKVKTNYSIYKYFYR